MTPRSTFVGGERRPACGVGCSQLLGLVDISIFLQSYKLCVCALLGADSLAVHSYCITELHVPGPNALSLDCLSLVPAPQSRKEGAWPAPRVRRASCRVRGAERQSARAAAAPPPTCVPVASVLENSPQLIGSLYYRYVARDLLPALYM